MRALIPLAGKGDRLMPHSAKRQKALLPVGDRAILDHILEPLLAIGVSELTLVVGHLGDQVRTHMEAYDQLQVDFVDQTRQEGLGHAVHTGLSHGALAETADGEPLIIALADTLFEMDYAAFIEPGGNVIGVAEVKDPRRFGVVETVGRRVVEMVEKPDEPLSNLAIAGIYLIDNPHRLRQALSAIIEGRIRTKGEYQLTDGLNRMVERGEVFHVHTVDGWLDCGTPETLLSTNRHLLQALGGAYVHPDATVTGSTVRSSSVMAGCRVVESILDDCIVLPGAQLVKCFIHGEIVKEGAQLTGYSTGGN